jgi:hypothetical protein
MTVRPVFVTGCMRSGTTLLQRVLVAAPGAGRFLNEAHYLAEQLSLHERARSTFALRLSDTFDSPDDFDAFTRALVLRYLDRAVRAGGGERVVVLKSPELTRHIPRLARWLPEARFVVSVRDPRDTVASMLQVAARHRSEGVHSALTQAGRDMVWFARFYAAHYQPVLPLLKALEGQVFLLRYEQLVGQPERVLPGLGAALGLPLAPEGVAAEGVDVAYFDEERRQADPFIAGFWSPLYEGGLSAARVGRHTEVLEPAEVARLQAVLAPLNRLFGWWD